MEAQICRVEGHHLQQQCDTPPPPKKKENKQFNSFSPLTGYLPLIQASIFASCLSTRQVTCDVTVTTYYLHNNFSKLISPNTSYLFGLSLFILLTFVCYLFSVFCKFVMTKVYHGCLSNSWVTLRPNLLMTALSTGTV